MTLKELHLIQSWARDTLLQISPHGKFAEMARPLTEGEKLALSYYVSVVQHLNKNGFLKEGLTDPIVTLVVDDSMTQDDDYV